MLILNVLFWIVWLASLGFLVISFLSLKNFLQRMRAVEIVRRQGAPEELGDLEQSRLVQATRDLEALGFEWETENLWSATYGDVPRTAPLADPMAAPPLAPMRLQPQGLERIFFHPTHGCWGTINFSATQDTRGKRPTIVNFLIILTSLGEGSREWSYTTRNSKYTGNIELIIKLFRQMRALSTVTPGATPAQLLETHLSRRAQIARAEGIVWQNVPVLNNYRALDKRAISQMHDVANALTPFQLMRLINRLKRERDTDPPEWLGELQGRI